ncbi:MAG: hypothetical protein H6662_15655 [Ardenticatenaceae bacterium]|nr:hypothetical protein [Anaerolineales bacterium]MCB8923023.1 hypothetical protein [Ardenticatenaceae bacterium]
MAITFRIYDPLGDVDFADYDLHIQRNGFKQQGPLELRPGEWADLQEKVTFRWLQPSETLRLPVLKALAGFGKRARDNQRPSSSNYFSPGDQVILEINTGSELGYRYAILRDVRMDELSPLHWRPSALPELALEFEREGLWRGIAPDVTPPETGLVHLENYDSQGGTASNAAIFHDLDGDAPAQTILKAQMSGSFSTEVGKVIIATRNASSVSDATKFTPFFNAKEELDYTAYQAAATNPLTTGVGPDGVMLRFPAGVNTGYLRWQLPYTVDYFAGRYRVYFVGRTNDDTKECRLGITHGYGTTPGGTTETIDYRFGSGGITWGAVDMGIITLPEGRLVGGVAASSAYFISLYFSKDSALQLDVASIFLVPQDTMLYSITNSPVNLVADGIMGRSYGVDAIGYVSTPSLGNLGRFIEISPVGATAIYVYIFDLYSSPYSLFEYTTDCWLSVRAAPRYQYLRTD